MFYVRSGWVCLKIMRTPHLSSGQSSFFRAEFGSKVTTPLSNSHQIFILLAIYPAIFQFYQKYHCYIPLSCNSMANTIVAGHYVLFLETSRRINANYAVNLVNQFLNHLPIRYIGYFIAFPHVWSNKNPNWSYTPWSSNITIEDCQL